MELFQIQHVTSSPHFPQSNVFAETMVKIAKKHMDHSTLPKKPWNFGLMEYRCTPLTGNIPLPMELLTGWKPRTSLPSIPWGNSATRKHHEALIKKQQMDISEELSISTYELGWKVLCFDTLNKIWKPALILQPATEPHSYWCRMENSNQKLRRTRLHIKPCLNTAGCEEKQMLSSTQMEENHTFQFTPAMDGNESPIPTIASLPDTPSKVPDRSPTARKSTTHSTTHYTPMEQVRRCTRITKGVPPKWLIHEIKWTDAMEHSITRFHIWNNKSAFMYIWVCDRILDSTTRSWNFLKRTCGEIGASLFLGFLVMLALGFEEFAVGEKGSEMLVPVNFAV